LKRYLIINPFGIGDVLFTTPVIRSIKDVQPDSQISYWCNDRVAPIIRNNPNINEVFPLSRGDLKKIFAKSRLEGISRFWNLILGIKKGHFDISLDFSLDHRYSLLTKLAGVKKRVGFNYKKRGRFLTDKIDIEGYHAKHIIEYYLDLLKVINIDTKSRSLELRVEASDREKIKKLLSYSGVKENDLIVGVAPGAGASWGKDATLKHWPAIRFAQVADIISDEFGAKILILGSKEERPIADIIYSAMRNKPIDLVGRTSLNELGAIISYLRILIANDGGPLHMAVALGVKTVSIFGPVDEKVYGPYPASQNHIVIKKELSCRPCYQYFRTPVCDRNRECIKSISVEEVLDAVRRLW
jgi:lipopolysaccharide heptosyltransferase II